MLFRSPENIEEAKVKLDDNQQGEKSGVNVEETNIKRENKENIEELKVPEWSVFDLPPESGFSVISPEISVQIKQKTFDTPPIIQEIFEKIASICENGFDFMNQRISFEKFLEFFKAVNQIIPKLSEKITQTDCKSCVFYIGDSHGSIEDMYKTIAFFMQIFEKDNQIKFVFVGDYVDRNPWDLQNLAFVVGFALLYRNNVVLLRGNHEDRTINTHYGFIDNLLRAFWDQGTELYDEIIKFFIKLPIANITQIFSQNDQPPARVLSVHGGIPVDQTDFFKPIILTEIKDKVTSEVERSEEMDPLTVSMLWADPDEMIKGIVTDDQGSGRLRFGEPVFELFMGANNLHLLVRGHQKWNDGIRIFFQNRLYSLFSTSKYDDRKKFNPKILQLAYGKSPVIHEIDEQTFLKVIESYTPN